MSVTAFVSSEFLLLCQGQLSLLAQGVEASLAIVYLAEEWLGGQTNNLVPIVAYPGNAADILQGMPLQLTGASTQFSGATADALQDSVASQNPYSPVFQSNVDSATQEGGAAGVGLSQDLSSQRRPELLQDSATDQQVWSASPQGAAADTVSSQELASQEPDIVVSGYASDEESMSGSVGAHSPVFEATILDESMPESGVLLDDVMSAAQQQSAHTSQTHFSMPEFGAPNFVPGFQQAVRPIYHDNRPVGVLVMARKGKPWLDEDYRQLEQVSYTLSAACGMEHRLQWLQNRFQQQEIVQERQQDLLDNLIHQFRNPLTALRTFGKLLVRRLGAEDPNQRVAEGIVRESDRLQALLKQMNVTVDHYGLLPADALPPGSSPAPDASPDMDADIIEGNWEPGPQEISPDAEIRDSMSLPAEAAMRSSAPSPANALPAASPLTGAPLLLEACNIAELLGPLLDSFGAIAQERGQILQLHVHPPAPHSPILSPFPFQSGLTALAEAFPVQGNPDALREVISNLVDNGLKYGHPDGTVAVIVAWDGTPTHPQAQDSPVSSGPRLTLCISDDGPGIPSTDLPHLFERHYRGIQAEGEKPGTGLGLAIAKDFVEQMQGQLTVVSPAGIWHPNRQHRSESEPHPEYDSARLGSDRRAEEGLRGTVGSPTTAAAIPQGSGSAFVIQLQCFGDGRSSHERSPHEIPGQ